MVMMEVKFKHCFLLFICRTFMLKDEVNEMSKIEFYLQICVHLAS